MSTRFCIQKWQGRALCSRAESQYLGTPHSLGKTQFPQPVRRFTCGRLTVSESRFRLQHTRASKWSAGYTYSRALPQVVRRNDFDSVWGEGTLLCSFCIQGLRAFLPLAEFIKHPDAAKGESHEAYVGRTLWVTITYARETRGNITLSEKDVWIKRSLQLGSLLDGNVTKNFRYGALVQVNETDIWGMIHISNIADGRINEVSDVFEIGEQVKVILVKSPVPDRLTFSTALLESEPGLLLRDKERVFREAVQTAIALRTEHPEWKQPTEDDDKEKPTTWIHSKPIANLEWLEFQQR